MLKKNKWWWGGGGGGAQGSGRWEGKRSGLLHGKGSIKEEKGGEEASGRQDERGGAHLDSFSRKTRVQTGTWEPVGGSFLT